MGIRKLQKYLFELRILRKFDNLVCWANDFRRRTKKSTIKIAIDAFNYFYKYKISCPHFLSGFYQQIVRMLRMKIIPVYVFDGVPPEEKRAELKIRREKRETAFEKIAILKSELELMSVTECVDEARQKAIQIEIAKLEQSTVKVSKGDINMVKTLLDIMHIPYIEAMGEADYLCSKLVRENTVDVCMSDDTDLLMSGCDRIIKYNNGAIIEFDRNEIITRMGLTFDMFRLFCLILGCGYHVDHAMVSDYQMRQAHNILRSGDNTRLCSFLSSMSLTTEIIMKYLNVYDTLYAAETSSLPTTTFDSQIDVIQIHELFSSLDIVDNPKVDRDIYQINNMIKYNNFNKPHKVKHSRHPVLPVMSVTPVTPVTPVVPVVPVVPVTPVVPVMPTSPPFSPLLAPVKQNRGITPFGSSVHYYSYVPTYDPYYKH